MKHSIKHCATLFLLAFASASQAALFQPDSATASSEFSGSYDIGNVIDGSGLPVGFTPLDAHSTYVQNNHWTTQANQMPGVSASFYFDSEVTIGTFYLWNHRSNGVASNPHYAVTQFDLILKDAGGATLFSLLDQEATPNVDIAQAYGFNPVAGVSQVDFIIDRNLRFDLGNASPNYTGVAEVAFGEINAVPVPGAIWLLGSALLGLTGWRRLQA